MKPTKTDDKPAANQASLQQLLSAAFIVQQHSERLQAGQPPENSYSQILKEILEVQEQLRDPNIGAREKIAMIARRMRQMTGATGSAIGLLNGTKLEYYTATGTAASEAGAEIPQEAALAYECLRTGQLLQSPVAQSDSRLNPQRCAALDVKALIAVPVKHEGKVAGVLELHFDQPNSFDEQEVRICQLASALVAEAILRPLSHRPESQVAPSVVPPSFKDADSLLAALEKIRPKLEHLARKPDTAPPAPSSAPSNPTDAVSAAMKICSTCGHRMTSDEAFCGLCGSPRQSQQVWSSLWDMQRKAETSARQNSVEAPAEDRFDDPMDVFPSELEEIVAKFAGEPLEEMGTAASAVALPSFAEELVEQKSPVKPVVPERAPKIELKSPEPVLEVAAVPEETESQSPTNLEDDTSELGRPFLLEKSPELTSPTEIYPSFAGFASDTSLLSIPAESALEAHARAENQDSTALFPEHENHADTIPNQNSPWGSAAKTKEWLEVQREQSGWLAQKWQQQRANIYLGAAAFLLLLVIVEWISPTKPPEGPVRASSGVHQNDAPPAPDLTLSEKILVAVGLADAPTPEVSVPGNPDTQVWIDVHTALYYCPGADLYGKTPDGRTSTQHQAQEDQFQPALRKACN